MRFDLRERTALFGERVISLAKRVTITPVTRCPVDQLVRAATSVGANYCEADDASSRRASGIGICLRDVKESKHWLRMLAAAVPELAEDARVLWREAQELTLIFAAIRRKLDLKATP